NQICYENVKSNFIYMLVNVDSDKHDTSTNLTLRLPMIEMLLLSLLLVIGDANELICTLEGEIKPIYEVDGKRVDENQLGIFPDDIKSVGILKSEAATDKYGSEGKYGAVHIYTFKGNGPDPAKMLNVDPLEREKELW